MRARLQTADGCRRDVDVSDPPPQLLSVPGVMAFSPDGRGGYVVRRQYVLQRVELDRVMPVARYVEVPVP